MRFGQLSTTINLHKIIIPIGMLVSVLFISSCKNKEKQSAEIGFKFPEQGQTFSLGQEVNVQLDVPAGTNIKAVTYLLDDKKIGQQHNADAFILKTGELSLGYKMITAIVDDGTRKDTVINNIVLKAAVIPAKFTYKVIHTYPHDTASYTEGLGYYNGKLLESTGEYGNSTLRWIDIQTGKAIQKINIDKKYFGEGTAMIGDKVIMLTYKEHIGFVYDAKSLKQLSTFPCSVNREGWGLTFDVEGQRLLNTDGSNRIWILNKDNYRDEGYIDVYDNNGPVNQLNEIECIDGKIYTNIYQTDKIAVINPKNGVVEQYIDLTGILPEKDRFPNTDVLNGIAWDAAGRRLFVTGKKFNKLFEIKAVPLKGN